MENKNKTEERLKKELGKLRKRIAELEEPETEREKTITVLHDDERKKAQKYLDVAEVILVVIDADQKVSLINKKGCEILGYKEKQIIGKNWFDNFLPQKIRDEVKKVFQKLIAGEIEPDEHFENPVLTRSGKERIIAWHNTLLEDDDGNIISTLSSGEDITERKRAEKDLKESEERFRQLSNASMEGIVIHEKGDILDSNQTVARMFGYELSELKGMNVLQLAAPESRDMILKNVLSGYKKPYEAKGQRKDGSTFLGELRGRSIPYKGRMVRVTAVRDISARKKAEKIQASLYKLSEVAHSARNIEEFYCAIHETITELMPAKNNFYIALHDEAAQMLTFPHFVDEYEENPGPQKLGKGLTEYVLRTGEPLLASPDVFNKLEKEGEIISVGPPSIDWLGVPLNTQNRNIGVLVVQSYTEGVRYTEEDKNILMFISEQVAMAIERKHAEEALLAEKTYLQQLFESAGEAIVLNAKDGRILSVNDEFVRIFGYTHEEAVGKLLDNLVVPEDLFEEAGSLTKRAADAEKVSFETVRRRKDGTLFDVSILGTPIIIGGEQVAVYSIYRDITEQKHAEKQIMESLNEKEILLREIHHRVKNNMQIISSLLRLQSRSIKDKKMSEMFKQSQSRIRSMALIHETLYKSEDMARIDFAVYVDRLTTHLFSMYRVELNVVNLKVDLKDVYLDINRAIPCGLIINELVSNSLKHAFPSKEKGEISVKMHKDKRDKYTLIVKDTGMDFPDRIDFQNPETLGLQIINDLTNQLGGTIRLEKKAGTTFRIEF